MFKTRISYFRLEGGLLLLDAFPQMCLVSRNISHTSEERVIRLHQRIGHPPFELLETCFPFLYLGVNAKTLFCEAYYLAKLHHLTFRSIDDLRKYPFDRIHSDVWGPSPFLTLS